MLNHKRNALSIALAVALTPVLASAQSATNSAEQQVKELDSITVTGIRRAIEFFGR